MAIRDQVGGYPSEIEKRGKLIRLKFYPKSADAKYPNNPILILRLDQSDKEKLLKIFD